MNGFMAHQWFIDPNEKHVPKQYLECAEKRNCLAGDSLEVISYGWQVVGPTKRHRFLWGQKATVQGKEQYASIHFETFIEHWIATNLISRFLWGHDTVFGYVSASEIKPGSRPGAWHTGLLGSNVLRNDLPCCGGTFVKERDYAGYSTLSVGRCNKCGFEWEIVDGVGFTPASDWITSPQVFDYHRTVSTIPCE